MPHSVPGGISTANKISSNFIIIIIPYNSGKARAATKRDLA